MAALCQLDALIFTGTRVFTPHYTTAQKYQSEGICNIYMHNFSLSYAGLLLHADSKTTSCLHIQSHTDCICD